MLRGCFIGEVWSPVLLSISAVKPIVCFMTEEMVHVITLTNCPRQHVTTGVRFQHFHLLLLHWHMLLIDVG